MIQKEMTLREKVLLLNLKPRNAPEGIKVATFGKWLRAVQKGEDVGPIAASFLTLLCDGMLNKDSGLMVGALTPADTNLGRKMDVVAENFSEIKPIGSLVTPEIRDVARLVHGSKKKVEAAVMIGAPVVDQKIPANEELLGDIPIYATTVDSFDCNKSSFAIIDEMCQMDVSPKISAKKDIPSATPTGFASWGKNMTGKVSGNVLKLNANDKAYTISLEKAKSGFLIEGQRYELPDFGMV